MLTSLFRVLEGLLATSFLSLFILFSLPSCQAKQVGCKENILGLQLTDANGFTETVTNPKHLREIKVEDFNNPQPYQKIVVTFADKQKANSSNSKILSYYPNGQLHEQLLVKSFQAYGEYNEWYPNGERKVIASLKGGSGDLTADAKKTWVFNGSFLAFYPDGKSKAKFSFANGKATEKAVHFFPSGQIQKQEHFLSGQLHGCSETFSNSGKLIEKGSYYKGDRHGQQTLQVTDKKFKLEELYDHGKLLQGRYYLQDSLASKVEKGNGKRCTIFKEGVLYQPIADGVVSGICELYNKDGHLIKTESFMSGTKDGEEVLYYPSSKKQKKLSLNWKGELLSGTVSSWYPNGSIESNYTLIDGVKEGKSKAWYRSGQLMFHEEYREGKLVDAEYYKNGISKAASSIKHGKGTALLFNEDNTQHSKISYENGLPI